MHSGDSSIKPFRFIEVPYSLRGGYESAQPVNDLHAASPVDPYSSSHVCLTFIMADSLVSRMSRMLVLRYSGFDKVCQIEFIGAAFRASRSDDDPWGAMNDSTQLGN